MTTTYHTPIATSAAANASTFNLPFGQLDAQLVDMMNGATFTGAIAAPSASFTGTVAALNYTGDGSALTGIATGTGGVTNTGSTTIGADTDANGAGEIALQTANTTRLTVTNAGDVGIGTGIPGYKLHVAGSVGIVGVATHYKASTETAGESALDVTLAATPAANAGAFVAVNGLTVYGGDDCTNNVIGVKGYAKITDNYVSVLAGVDAVAECASTDATAVGKSVYAMRAGAFNSGSGNVPHLMGLKINTPLNTGGGTIDHNWGIYIANQDVDSGHGAAALHIAGAGPDNAIGFSGVDSDEENARIYSDGSGLLCITAGAIGINTTTRKAPYGLDISTSDIGLCIGADTGGGTTRTDATVKVAALGVPHYTNAEQPACVFQVSSNAANNMVTIGGGSAGMNAATYITFYTAADGTTVTGTERMRIDEAGRVGIGTAAPGTRLDIGAGAVTIAEMSAPAGAANSARLFVQDNGGGKSQLMVIFASGVAQQIAIEA